MAGPTREFWEQRFAEGNTPWDRGETNPQLGAWLAAGALKPCRILVPGCGSGHEVAALARAGFEVSGLDYAPIAIARTRKLLATLGAKAELIEADALAWQPPRPYDAIYEQTCLCALYPDQWREYADQLHRWLALSLRYQCHESAFSGAALVLAQTALSAHRASARPCRARNGSAPQPLECRPTRGDPAMNAEQLRSVQAPLKA